MEPPQDAKPETRRASPAGPSGRPSLRSPMPVRNYPRPPALFPRILLFCFQPESWAQAARYPSRFTFVPLLLAIFFAAIAVGAGEAQRMLASLTQFATTYNDHHPPLEFNSDGILSVKGDLPSPIRFELEGTTVLIDPTGKTTPESIKSSQTFLLTDKEVILASGDGSAFRQKIAEFPTAQFPMFFLPPKDHPYVINTQTLTSYVNANGSMMAVFTFIIWATMQAISDLGWTLLMIFLITPLIILAAAGPRGNPDVPDRRLILPKRAAHRMAAAVLIPLILLSGMLHAFGHPISRVMGSGTMLFWFVATSALGIWTGLMARRMYVPVDPRRRGT